MANVIRTTIDSVHKLTSLLPEWFIALVVRFAVASVFWRSVQTKISGGELFGQYWQFWNISESTFMLFEYEYTLPLLPVKLAAGLATYAEFFLSLAIILGLLTRLSAVGLLGMTLVIQLFVYPDAWAVHILWIGLLLYLIKHGGGLVSVDHIVRKTMM